MKFPWLLALFLSLALPSLAWAQDVNASFDQKKWDQLAAEQEHSPCLKDRTAKCLLNQAVLIRIAAGTPLDLKYDHGGYEFNHQGDGSIISEVVESGDKDLAQKLINILPPDAAQRKMQLLFTLGRDDEAVKLLSDVHATQQKGGDYGAIWAAFERGDLGEALKIARMTISWGPPPTEKRMIAVSSFCHSDPSQYPLNIEQVGKAFAQRKDYDKAHEAALLIKQYRDNKFNGMISSNCEVSAVRRAYYGAMISLMAAFKNDQQADKEKATWAELKEGIKSFDFSDVGYSELLFSGDLAKNGLKEEALEAVDKAKIIAPKRLLMNEQYDSPNSHGVTDDAALILAEVGEYDEAIKRVESLGNAADSNEASTPMGGNDEYLPVKIDTLLDLARSATDAGDKKEAQEILKHLEPYLGHRSVNKHANPIMTLSGPTPPTAFDMADYVTFADRAASAGDPEKAKWALSKARDIEAHLTKSYNDRYNDYYIFDRPELYNKLDDTADILRLLDTARPGDYQRIYDVLSYFAAHDMWHEYDQTLQKPGMIGTLSYGSGMCFGKEMFDHGQRERFVDLINKLDDGYAKRAFTSDLIDRSFAKDSGVSDDALKKYWQMNLASCGREGAPVAEERMAGCYLWMYLGAKHMEFEHGKPQDMEFIHPYCH
jgi:hypothetical protein